MTDLRMRLLRPRVRRSLAPLLTTALIFAGQAAHGAPLRSPPGSRQSANLVTLITGERVLVGTSPGGQPTALVIRSTGSGPASQLTTVSLGGDLYAIPLSAQPYLSRYLDPGLFDVTKLAAAGVTDRLPLRIDFTPGSVPSLPGITITSTGNGIATGYVTASLGRAFGAALAAQAAADQQAGWPASSPLFGSVTRIAPDLIAAAQPAVIPYFPMRTLIIKGISPSGRPLPFSVGLLMNSDNGSKFAALVFLVHGEARVSVPLGHYAGVFDDLTFSAGGDVDIRLMPFADYNVSSDLQTLTLDAGLAVASPSVTTPLPSVGQDLAVSINGSDAAGHFSFGSEYDLTLPGARLRLAPVAQPTVGTFTQTTRWIRVDPSVAGGHYTFDANFIDEGVPAAQAQVVPDLSQLAKIEATYASDRPLRIGGAARFVFLPGSFFASATFDPLPMPLSRTEYVYAPAGTMVEDMAMADMNAWDPGIMQDDMQSADLGSVRSENWLRNPYSLGVPDASAADPYPLCLACRSATAMTFVTAPSDGVATHQGWVFGAPFGPAIAHFSVYRNGTLLLKEPNSLGDFFTVPWAPATYRVVSDLDRGFTGSLLSTHTRTDVTFRSGALTGPPMPTSWICFTALKCRVLPVLRAFVDLHATPLGTLPVGPATFDVSVGHIAGAQDPAIASVTVAVRRAGSTSWTLLRVASVGPGLYRSPFIARSGMNGKAMDIRITATDVDGGVLRQLTERAFLVSS